MNNKNPKPSESDQQWLKELFESAGTEPSPETAPGASFDADDEQWLKDLFASAEQAAELEFVSEEPEEEPLVDDFQLTDWPEESSDSTAEGAEPAPDETTSEETPSEETPSKETPSEETPDSEETDSREKPGEETTPEEAPEETSSEEDPAQKPQQPKPPSEHSDGMILVEEEEEAPEEDEEKEEESEEKSDSVKRRPKNKDSYGLFGIPHVLVTGVWLAIILAFGVFLGTWLWQGASDVLAFGREEKVVTITITESDDLESVIDKLHSSGLINEPMWFRWYAKITDVMEDIGTGTFELNTLYDYRALVAHMSSNSAARVTVKVRIPEGYTCAQTFALLEEKGVCSVADLEAAVVGGSINDYWFLEGLSLDSKYALEGYLFPDTYEFYVGDDATRVLNALLANFKDRFTDIMQAKLEVLNETLAEMMRKNGMSEAYIEDHEFTIREIVIIASMIEKETAGASESYTISSVIYNRLTNPTEHPYLNIDAALVYITGNSQLTEDDKAFDSPYNTYLYPGLIPGPICNPSRASLDAALDPAATDYYFYAYNPATFAHHFSKTYAEHQAFLDSLPKEEPETP